MNFLLHSYMPAVLVWFWNGLQEDGNLRETKEKSALIDW